MNNSNNPNFLTLVRRVLAIVACFFAFLSVAASLRENALPSAFCFLALAIILFGTLRSDLKERFPLLKNRSAVIVICITLTVFGMGMMKDKNEEVDNIAKTIDSINNKPDSVVEANGIDTVDFQSLISLYIISNPEEQTIKNMHTLADYEALFFNMNSKSNSVMAVNKDECHIRGVLNDTLVVVYSPTYGINDKIDANEYLNPVGKYGELIDYKVAFYISNNSVLYTNPILVVSNKDHYLDTVELSQKIALEKYAKKQIVAKQRKSVGEYLEIKRIEKQNEDRIAAVSRQMEEFKQNCLRSNNACLDLIVYVKQYLHDPSSFKHVYTNYRIEGDHAVLIMQYRAKNALGALVLSSVVARVSFDCQVLSVQEQ